MNYTLPDLEYNYDALEPYFDKETMEIHYNKHHQAYVNNLNIALKDFPELSILSVEKLIANLNQISDNKRDLIRNNAGGHANHSFFWKSLKKGTVLHGNIKEAININFGSVEQFKYRFEEKALSHFGSGWIWLVLKDNKMEIVSTANQDSPIMGKDISGASGFPIIGLDIWEHAYYLKFQNRRLDYVKEYWNVINWDIAEIRFINKC